MYPGSDLDQSQNLTEPKLNKDPSSHFLFKIQTVIFCIILLTNRQTNGHEINTSLAEVTNRIQWSHDLLSTEVIKE